MLAWNHASGVAWYHTPHSVNYAGFARIIVGAARPKFTEKAGMRMLSTQSRSYTSPAPHLDMMQPIATAVLLLAHIHVVYGQTLYAVVNPNFPDIVEGTTFVSAVGVGADGWTTYVQSGTISLDVQEGPSTTVTVVSAPARFVGGFEENASGYRASLVGGEFAETCAFGPDGRGTCVEKLVQASSTRLNTTYSGSIVPVYTIAALNAPSKSTTPPLQPTSSPGPPSSTPTSASSNSALAKGFSIACILVSCVVGTILHIL
ncbi:hypothetical protein MVEN_01842000 [Mycena venus]|uniref:Uncharacterized protein n=1 Tax=Mycena venus TaxID=2733690 RepID=A0A8H6XJU7_9AGAR|nr:hypothetical protein MVEN_01842000 [Mycena venus]